MIKKHKPELTKRVALKYEPQLHQLYPDLKAEHKTILIANKKKDMSKFAFESRL